MLGRSKEEDDGEQAAGWTQRVDKLLAGNLSQQVGSAVEALAKDFADLASRVEGLSEKVSSLASPDLSSVVETFEARIASLPTAEDIERAVRQSAPDLSAVEAMVREGLAGLQLPAPAPGSAELETIIESKLRAVEEHVENLGRNIGGAMGRLRVQNDELIEKAAALAALRDGGESTPGADALRAEIATLRDQLAGMEKAVGDRIAANSFSDQITAAQNAIEDKIASLPSGEQVAAEIARREQDNASRMEGQSQQIAAVAARVKAAMETFGTQLQQIGQRTDVIATVREEIGRIHEATDASAVVSSEMSAAIDAGVGRITEALATLEARISAMPSDESLLATRDEVIRETAGAVERISRELSDRLGAAIDAIQTAPTIDSVGELLREEREGSERRNEALVHQVAAVMGSVISSMGEMRSQLQSIEERPDVPAALRDEIGAMLENALAPAAERLAGLERLAQQSAEGIRPMFGEIQARLQHVEDVAVSQSDSIVERVNEASAGAAQRVAELLHELDAQITALPDGARVEALMDSIRKLEEEMRKERTEQFSTLSASVGAIYLRVRSLEQAISELKLISENQGGNSQNQISSVLERFDEVASLEQRLAQEITAIQEALQRGTSERERDREILAVLAQLADSAGKGDRGRLAEKLKALIARGSKYEDAADGEDTVTLDISGE